MINYLNNNKDTISKFISPVLNFKSIMLPLKQTVWYVRQLTERQQQRATDKKKLNEFVSRLEK